MNAMMIALNNFKVFTAPYAESFRSRPNRKGKRGSNQNKNQDQNPLLWSWADPDRCPMDTFENKIYPTDRAFFGSEWTPGVDDDPHIYILYTNGLGQTAGGYFSSSDEYPPQISQYSNAHEMFYINSSESLSEPYTFGSLAQAQQRNLTAGEVVDRIRKNVGIPWNDSSFRDTFKIIFLCNRK